MATSADIDGLERRHRTLQKESDKLVDAFNAQQEAVGSGMRMARRHTHFPRKLDETQEDRDALAASIRDEIKSVESFIESTKKQQDADAESHTFKTTVGGAPYKYGGWDNGGSTGCVYLL